MGFSYAGLTSPSFAVKEGPPDFPSFIHESLKAVHPDQRRKPSYGRRSRHSAAQYGESPNGQIPLAFLRHLSLGKPDAASQYAQDAAGLAAWELLP